MAERSRPEKSLADIRQEIAHSRDRLSRDLSGLSYELDFPLKFRKSFQRNMGIWVSAAVLTGVATTARVVGSNKTLRIKTKDSGKSKAEEHKKGLLEAGLAMGLLRFAAAVAKPVAVNYVRRKFGNNAGRR